jgi:putative hydrolase of the HAD superfamily
MENSFLRASNRFEGIFFDAGNTLLTVYPSVAHIYSNAAASFGLNIPMEAIENSFKELWVQTAPLVSNEGHRLTYEKERDWWKFLVKEVFRDHLDAMDFDQFFDHLYHLFEDVESWRLYEDVITVLSDLKERGFILAIVSNWDSRLPSLCDRLGITSFFDAVIVSALVGYEKPHPNIFQIALTQTGLSADQVMYIGDDPFLDYQAARKIGIHSLHLDRTNRFPDHPDRITVLSDLFQFL